MLFSFFIYPFLFLLGALLGAWVNGFVDRFCWTPRFRSPWRSFPNEFYERLNAATPTVGKKKKTAAVSMPFTKISLDFVPIFGWISLSRLGKRLEKLPEAERLPGLETSAFWVRPFFTELFAALGVCWLFWWEVDQQALLAVGLNPEPFPTVALRFGVHVLLFTLLLAASLIDFDDMIIPDVLTVPGTIFGLILAAVLPQTPLPATELQLAPPLTRELAPPLARGLAPGMNIVVAPNAVPLNIWSPNPDQPEKSTVGKAVLAVGLWWFWCFAMLERVWHPQLPFRKAAAIFWRRLKRSPTTLFWSSAAIGIPAIFVLLWTLGVLPAGKFPSNGLLASLVGMATGMGLIWGGRLVAGFVLDREAMGFGDVTLMGMIGAFVGWQTTILIFFLAPCIGLGFAVANYLAGRGKEIPYGPYLCVATTLLIVFWKNVWEEVAPVFELGPGILAVAMGVCLLLLGLMLWTWLQIKMRIFSDAPDEDERKKS